MGKKKKETIVLDKHAVLAEAATQLMLAQEIALKDRDVKKLVQISYAWSHLSEKFTIVQEPPGEEQKKYMGFVMEVKDE